MEKEFFLELISYFDDYADKRNITMDMVFDVPFQINTENIEKFHQDQKNNKFFQELEQKVSKLKNSKGEALELSDYFNVKDISSSKFSFKFKIQSNTTYDDYLSAMKVFDEVRGFIGETYDADFSPLTKFGSNRITTSYATYVNGKSVFADLPTTRNSAKVNGMIQGQLVEAISPFVLTSQDAIDARWPASHRYGAFYQPEQTRQAYSASYEHRGEEKWYGFRLDYSGSGMVLPPYNGTKLRVRV